MAIYYFDGNIIGRSSRRFSVGAAAYRAGEKLRSVAHAAYQSGEELRAGEIVHDYTRKGGVVHSEIILPDNTPEEYKDRQTLWNAVEKRERRKDAQLAREFVVALPREFDLPEQIEVMREYIGENFANKGMIADFSIHDKGDGTPHAHIMLTTRDVSPDGFGLKNTDWNKKGKNAQIHQQKIYDTKFKVFIEEIEVEHPSVVTQMYGHSLEVEVWTDKPQDMEKIRQKKQEILKHLELEDCHQKLEPLQEFTYNFLAKHLKT
ncbi:MAG: MobA/MobL family protein [Nitrososphaerota archaeon]|jgi:ATP-dependent exoDNAse (exonuclease V) alpha subunit|nr:MobA/MobL family protein [Nitrososphaerota archaeon]